MSKVLSILVVLQDNQIVHEGKFIFVEVFQLVSEEGMVEYHHFSVPSKIINLGNCHECMGNIT